MHSKRFHSHNMPDEMRKCGAYRIRNTYSGKIYAGGTTTTFAKRRKAHRDFLRAGKHRNDDLQADWDEYGEHYFVFEIVEITEKDGVVPAEQRLIDSVPVEMLYNRILMAGELPGRKHCAKTVQKMSASHMGIVRNVGTKQSAEWIAKRVAKNTGKKRSEEAKAATSRALKGRKKSEAHCAAMSAAMKGRKVSEEQKAKQSAAMKGRKKTAEHADAISRGLTGKKHSPERVARMREGLLRGIEKRKQQKLEEQS